MAWSVPGVERVVGLRFADAFGTFALMREPGRAETIDGRACAVGGFLAIDVGGLHDIDGDVELTLVLDRETSRAMLIGYDAVCGIREHASRRDPRWRGTVGGADRHAVARAVRGPRPARSRPAHRGARHRLHATPGRRGTHRDRRSSRPRRRGRLAVLSPMPASSSRCVTSMDDRPRPASGCTRRTVARSCPVTMACRSDATARPTGRSRCARSRRWSRARASARRGRTPTGGRGTPMAPGGRTWRRARTRWWRRRGPSTGGCGPASRRRRAVRAQRRYRHGAMGGPPVGRDGAPATPTSICRATWPRSPTCSPWPMRRTSTSRTCCGWGTSRRPRTSSRASERRGTEPRAVGISSPVRRTRAPAGGAIRCT